MEKSLGLPYNNMEIKHQPQIVDVRGVDLVRFLGGITSILPTPPKSTILTIADILGSKLLPPESIKHISESTKYIASQIDGFFKIDQLTETELEELTNGLRNFTNKPDYRRQLFIGYVKNLSTDDYNFLNPRESSWIKKLRSREIFTKEYDVDYGGREGELALALLRTFPSKRRYRAVALDTFTNPESRIEDEKLVPVLYAEIFFSRRYQETRQAEDFNSSITFMDGIANAHIKSVIPIIGSDSSLQAREVIIAYRRLMSFRDGFVKYLKPDGTVTRKQKFVITFLCGAYANALTHLPEEIQAKIMEKSSEN